jgi:hypothetical protein
MRRRNCIGCRRLLTRRVRRGLIEPTLSEVQKFSQRMISMRPIRQATGLVTKGAERTFPAATQNILEYRIDS